MLVAHDMCTASLILKGCKDTSSLTVLGVRETVGNYLKEANEN